MTDRRRVRRTLAAWIAIAAVALVAGYGAFRAKSLAEGPEIAITSPINGAVVHEALVEVSGTAKNISFLTLDGGKIFTDGEGAWKERVILSKGYNTVTVRADDRFGRSVSRTIEIIYN
ncbi:MAG TPA: hypothetical protein VIR98_03360 [Candidatus Paceibacterota bacterium]|jgi:hypothetical protein